MPEIHEVVRPPRADAVIVGAGPYGLSAAAHLRAAGLDTQVFGHVMGFWSDHMPRGMLLRSPWAASNLSNPASSLTLDAFQASEGRQISRPVPLTDFVRYGHWFADRAVGDVDERLVTRIERLASGFSITLEDGSRIETPVAIVATGIAPFARRQVVPRLPRYLASHSSDHADLGHFSGKRVAVVGSGQSAIESAALLNENGADVDVLARAPELNWLIRSAGLHKHLPFLYSPTDVGPAGVSWLIAVPPLFRRIPVPVKRPLASRSIRPAAAAWLQSRVDGIHIRTSVSIMQAQASEGQADLLLSTGERLLVDHVLLATGFQVDIRHYPFLPPELLERVRMRNGIPVLGSGFESSVPGLHFLGAPASDSYGPLLRFVAGAGFASRSLARHLLRSRSGIRVRG